MSGKPEHQLHVLCDADGRKLAEKLFDRYIRREQNNFSRHPEFMLALDRLISSFGGVPADTEEPDGDDPEQDYDDDEDIHETRDPEQASLSRVLKHVLKNTRR